MNSKIKYIHVHELPYKPIKQLCDILDADKRWKELGGYYMKYDVTTITLIGQASYPDKSPTFELLKTYSERNNGTIECLFTWLYKMDHKKAMSILEPYGASYNSQQDSLPDFMNVPFSEICKATDNFNEAHVLGKGGFGIVYKGEWKGASVAIKRLIPKKCNNPSRQLVSFKQSLNELNILKCCRFDYILPLYAISLDGIDPCLIYRLMVNGSLEDRLLCKNKTPPLTWLQRSHIAECTAKGLNYLHTTYEKPLVHGDIKSANILLDNNMEAKIGDFGLTREGPNSNNTHLKVTSVHGTECYLPEEYLRFKKLSPQVDIFSYGIVMLEIATGRRPFNSQTKKSLVEQVRSSEGSGCLDSLRDVKAGEENMMWFRELVRIGQECSSHEKKKRPLMQKVLGDFKKVKTEMSMIDGIRLIVIGDQYENMGPIKNSSLNPEETESSNQSFSISDSSVSSDSTSESESESEPSVDAKQMEQGASLADKNVVEAEARVSPKPLISMLNMKVSEFQNNSNKPSSEKIAA